MDLVHTRTVLESAGVVFAQGLRDHEFDAAEARFGFAFPPDLREFLSFALPTGAAFPNWRNVQDPALSHALAWPLEGLRFDVKQNSLWLPEWGPKPATDAAAFEVLKDRVAAAPTLIPIQGHRYMPSRPAASGNPVLSVYQSDIIYYGTDLEHFFHNEYYHHFGTNGYSMPHEGGRVEFWSAFID